MKNEIIKIQEKNIDGHLVQSVNARDLHIGLENKKMFSPWIKARIKKYGFIEGEDFVVLLDQPVKQKGSGGHNKTEYFLSLDMAKEIAMVEATAKGRMMRKYFIDCEKRLLRQQKMRLTVDWQEARDNGKAVRSTLTKAIDILGKLADQQGGAKDRKYYSSVTKMIYKALFDDGSLKAIRDKLDGLHLTFLSICEEACADEIERLSALDTDYHVIFAECKKRVIHTVNGLSASKLSGKPGQVRLVWDKPQ